MLFILVEQQRDYDDTEVVGLIHSVFDEAKSKHIHKEMAGYLGLSGDRYKALGQWLASVKPGDVLFVNNDRTMDQVAIMAVAEGSPVRISRVETETKTVTETIIRLKEDHSRPNLKKKSKATKQKVE